MARPARKAAPASSTSRATATPARARTWTGWRVWFITDDAPVPDKVLEAYKGTIMLRADPGQLARFLLAGQQQQAAPALAAPIWIIDPLGNLMMQYPADADGVKVRKDVSKLVYNSRVG